MSEHSEAVSEETGDDEEPPLSTSCEEHEHQEESGGLVHLGSVNDSVTVTDMMFVVVYCCWESLHVVLFSVNIQTKQRASRHSCLHVSTRSIKTHS